MATSNTKSIEFDTLERAYIDGSLVKQIQSVERAIKAATSERMRAVLFDDLKALNALKGKVSHG